MNLKNITYFRYSVTGRYFADEDLSFYEANSYLSKTVTVSWFTVV
jgi:hypothetical protein